MPIPEAQMQALKRALDAVVLGNKALNHSMRYGIQMSILEQCQQDIEGFLKGNPADHHQYAEILHKYALISDRRKNNIYGWSASRDYDNAKVLFEKHLNFARRLRNQIKH